jgi:hypothetical protein
MYGGAKRSHRQEGICGNGCRPNATPLTCRNFSARSLGVVAGLPLAWTFAALAIGNAIGTIFMAPLTRILDAQRPQDGWRFQSA